MPTKSFSRFLILAGLGLGLLLAGGCSDDGPGAPTSGQGRLVLTLGDDVVLYAPDGTVGAANLSLETPVNIQPPPAGWLAAGPAVTVGPESGHFPNGLSLGLTFSYDILSAEQGLYMRVVRLFRLDDQGGWAPVPGSGSAFPMALTTRLESTGTYAALVDTTAAHPADLNAVFILRTTAYSGEAGLPTRWNTYLTATFEDPTGGAPDPPVTGPVRLAGFTLTDRGGGVFTRIGDTHDLQPGAVCAVEVPVGYGRPALDRDVAFQTRELEITHPPALASVDRNRDLTVTWTGTGPELVWLLVGGSRDQGWYGLTPNDGEFTVTREMLQGFAPGSRQQVFLQFHRQEALDAVGYGAPSVIVVETASVVRFDVP